MQSKNMAYLMYVKVVMAISQLHQTKEWGMLHP